METIKEISLASITTASVNIVVKEYVTVDGVKTQLGNTKRVCYNNIPRDRAAIADTLPEAYQKAIFALWDTVPMGSDPEGAPQE